MEKTIAAIVSALMLSLCAPLRAQEPRFPAERPEGVPGNAPGMSACGSAAAGTPVAVAFWNAENLYDTVPSPFGGDAEFTPAGRRRWNTERYRAKLEALARVLDGLSADVVGLAEVESEAALRDLAAALADDYSYIHRTTGDRRGVDLALLYRADRFFPHSVRQIEGAGPRQPLYVRGTLAGSRVDLLICHLPSKLSPRRLRMSALRRVAAFADSLRRADPQARLVVVGDMNCDPSEPEFRSTLGRTGLFMPLTETVGPRSGMARKEAPVTADSGASVRRRKGSYGRRRWAGTYVYDGRWLLYDNILLSGAFIARAAAPDEQKNDCGGSAAAGASAKDAGPELRLLRAGVYVTPESLGGDGVPPYARGAPRRTASPSPGAAGASDHLPVYAVFGRGEPSGIPDGTACGKRECRP